MAAGALGGARVLLTCDAVGGVWTYALDLARGLSARGVGTILVVLGPAPQADQLRDAAAIADLRLAVPDLPLDWTSGTPGQMLGVGDVLAELADASGAALVHLHGAALAASAAYPVPVVASAHSCVATWWAAVRGTALPADFVWRSDLVRRGCGRVAALIAPSRSFAKATAATYGLEREPVVVRNGRTLPASRPAAGDERAADLVFTAGRLWDEGKNVATLDRAAARMTTRVEAAGPVEGPNGARVGLRHLSALGRLPERAVRERLAARPVFVSTAIYEPFGLSVLEAAGAGCALVLSDIPTFRELWDGAALFVDPRDPGALARSLDRLAGSPSERRRLGTAAAERSARYGLDRFVDETLAVYRSVLGLPDPVVSPREAAA